MDRGAIIAAEPPKLSGIRIPCFATVQHNWVGAGHRHLVSQLKLNVPGGEDRQEFPELSSCQITSDGSYYVAVPTGEQHVTITHQAWCRRHSLR